MGTIEILKKMLTVRNASLIEDDWLAPEVLQEEITALTDAIAQLEWISVNDRMPEKETLSLVAFDDGFMTTVWFGNDGEWELWADCGEPTHWRTLPHKSESGDTQ